MCSTLHNRTCECSLNYQKSAEAIVPNISRIDWEGLNHLGRIIAFTYAKLNEAETIILPIRKNR